MKKLTTGDLGARSTDLIADNLRQIRAVFPEAFIEGRVNFDLLKQLLGDTVDEREEKYGLNWHGKRQARQLALTPSTGTLRPCPEQSVDWNKTQNLMIEGDNLEVLKLLQKSYSGKVKLIYIDPPYNTGKDFIYPDNYRDSIRNYQELTGQIDGENRKLSSNTEASGRFHTDWLNMMYPRLMVARNLLSSDGVIFLSIDENEVANVRHLCNDVFGEECFVSVLSVLCNPKGRSQDKYFATNHEYVVIYSKSILPKGFFSVRKDEHQIDAEYGEVDARGKYRLLELRNTHRDFGKHNRPNLYYPLFSTREGAVHADPGPGRFEVLPNWDDGFEGCWTWGREKVRADLTMLVAREVSGRRKIYRKNYASGVRRMLKTILADSSYYTERGQKSFNTIFNSKEKLFASPKAPELLSQLFQTATSGNNEIILDFFAGSGTTGHATMDLNVEDGGNRRYIVVQLPEPLDPDNRGQAAAADFCDQLGRPRTIAEFTKERLRRVGIRICNEDPTFAGDVGFRVFKLDASNMRSWAPYCDELEATLLDSVEHIREGRSEEDILYELLLKLGLDLCAPIATRVILGYAARSVGAGTLITCLAERIASEDVEQLALGIADWHGELEPAGETIVVFRDSAFANDVAKTNLTAILEQRGVACVRSL